jgi:putative transposase
VGEGGDAVSLAAFIADQPTSHDVPQALSCRALGVSESWFYKWQDRPPTPAQQRRAAVDAAVEQAFTASGGSYGSPRIHVDLVADGWTISVNTVAESMARQGLVARAKKRRKNLTRQDKSNQPFPDLVKRDFIAPAPNVKWESYWKLILLTSAWRRGNALSPCFDVVTTAISDKGEGNAAQVYHRAGR